MPIHHRQVNNSFKIQWWYKSDAYMCGDDSCFDKAVCSIWPWKPFDYAKLCSICLSGKCKVWQSLCSMDSSICNQPSHRSATHEPFSVKKVPELSTKLNSHFEEQKLGICICLQTLDNSRDTRPALLLKCETNERTVEEGRGIDIVIILKCENLRNICNRSRLFALEPYNSTRKRFKVS